MSENQAEVLTRILSSLKSDESDTRLSALYDLGRLNYSSQAILLRLEFMAVNDPNPAARRLALEALNSPTHRYIQKAISSLARDRRQLILEEIETWRDEGLMGEEQAQVLRTRYDFDSRRPEPTPQPAPAAIPAQSAPAAVEAAPAAAEVEEQVEAPKPPEPRASLSQRLLSQATVNVFLYLGAFLVIGAALILAALVQAARLPILAGVSIVFAASAIILKKRLPQPSFALFIVFSFLLPILARVLGESLRLVGSENFAYWALVLLVTAAIWGFSTWFYSSRLFSVVSGVSLMAAAYSFVRIFTTADAWAIMGFGVAALLGLGGAAALKLWKDQKFAMPLTIVVQVAELSLLLYSMATVAVHLFDSQTGRDIWLAVGLTWLAAAAFYAWSALLFSFALFPWAAAAALLPVSWFLPRAFEAQELAFTAAYCAAGALYAGLSELLARRSRLNVRTFSLPLLLAAVILFATAVISGLVGEMLHGFLAFTVAAVVLTALQVLRPRTGVWTVALHFWLGAWFTFFALPSIRDWEVLGSYQVLGASLLLTLPELFMQFPGGPSRIWRRPLVILGAVLVIINIAAQSGRVDGAWPALICFAAYAALFLRYALHFRRPALGYLATASAAAAVFFALWPLNGDTWLPVFTGLSVLYYLAGLGLRMRESTRPWANVLIISGLALGAITTAAALISFHTSGAPYVVIIAVMYFAELYLRPADLLESLGPLFLSAAAVLWLPHATANDWTHILLVVSLLWLIADLAYHITLKQRRLTILTRGVGVAVALANGIFLVVSTADRSQAALSFAVYSAVSLIYALLFHRPVVGYITTASAAAAVLFAISPIQGNTWLPVFTGLSVVYYAAGLALKFLERTRAWGNVLRLSGMGLGAVLSAAALISFNTAGAVYVVVVAALFFAELYLRPDDRLEPLGPLFLSIAALLWLPHVNSNDVAHLLLIISLLWLIADAVFQRTQKQRRLSIVTRGAGAALVLANSIFLLLPLADAGQAALCFAIYAAFAAFDAWFYREPRLGYAATSFIPLSVFFWLRAAGQTNWLYAIVSVAVVYYAAGYMLRRGGRLPEWSRMLLFSGLGLATINAVSAPLQTGLEAAIPVAIAATLFAAEAFAVSNVWLGFPANLLYLEAYFLILVWLKVDEPQYYSVGAALLGILMHYLLTRAGSKLGAFLTGLFSQLVLLGTSYIQLVSTERLTFFIAIFFQGLVMLAYGIVIRSRSLTVTPIVFIVLSVIAVVYSALKDISTVILIGGGGIILLVLGILAVLLRERLIKFGDQWGGWNA